MFDLDTLISDCIAANSESEPRLAIKHVLERAVSPPPRVAAALPPEHAGITRIHVSDDLTIIKVVWAPGMTLGPHDHRMWATIGSYTGGEDNAFYRRDGPGLVESGGRSLHPRDVCLLGDDAVNTSPTRPPSFAGAIHVYGGDFFTTTRSEWTGTPLTEHPYDVEHVLALFETANRTVDAP